MSVSIINLKFITKNIYRLFSIIIIILLIKILFSQMDLLKDIFTFDRCSNIYTSFFTCFNEESKEIYYIGMLNINYPILTYLNNKEKIDIINIEETEKVKKESLETTKNMDNDIIISENATTQIVTDRNIEESYNYTFDSVKIKNQSNYDMSDDLFDLDNVLFNNKKVVIYHTHTCESYTPSEKYNYEMTGNFRTTDLNFNVVKVGEELKKHLEQNGFKVIHNSSYHDFPSYNGSYERSFDTISNIIKDNSDAEIIIDLHRDAVGDGSWYGPTIKIDSYNVAQIMFVIRYRCRWIRSS